MTTSSNEELNQNSPTISQQTQSSNFLKVDWSTSTEQEPLFSDIPVEKSETETKSEDAHVQFQRKLQKRISKYSGLISFDFPKIPYKHQIGNTFKRTLSMYVRYLSKLNSIEKNLKKHSNSN